LYFLPEPQGQGSFRPSFIGRLLAAKTLLSMQSGYLASQL
jgi:hypothetical protein